MWFRSILALACCAGAVAEEASPFAVSQTRDHVERIRTSAHAFQLRVGGTADMENTATVQPDGWDIKFQNNVRLYISNTGRVPVSNPRVTVNGFGGWLTPEAMARDCTRGAKNDQERVYLLLEALNRHFHVEPIRFDDAERRDALRLLALHGGGEAEDLAAVAPSLFALAGLTPNGNGPSVASRDLHGHRVCEVWCDGEYQCVDPVHGTFFLDRENKKPVSGEAAAKDASLVTREIAGGLWQQDWAAAEYNAAPFYGPDDARDEQTLPAAPLKLVLRPGETMSYAWGNMGKRAWQVQDYTPKNYANATLVYDVPLGAKPPKFEPAAIEGFESKWHALRVAGNAASLVIVTESPYIMCGGGVRVRWEGLPTGGQVVFELSVRDGEFVPFWTSGGETDHWVQMLTDDVLKVQGQPPLRRYAFRLRCENAAGMRLTELIVGTDVLVNPLLLPRLRVGDNRVEYADDTSGRHRVEVGQDWVESESVVPPAPPAAPQSPAGGEAVKSTTIKFTWPAVEGCDLYQLRVSRDPELRYAYRPDFDVAVAQPEYEAPVSGLFNPGETYYWHVRARLANGLWSAWSPAWTFLWDGPAPPVDVQVKPEDGGLVLTWAKNSVGAAPVRFDVYGSDVEGFTPSRESRSLPVIGSVSGSFLGSTDGTTLRVAGPELTHENANRAFYRIVAVDANGTESGPSEAAALPRPFVYTQALTRARAGHRYVCLMRTISSLGRLQASGDSGALITNKDTWRFVLVKGPRWLRLDAENGLLRGEPDESNRGSSQVELVIRDNGTPPREARQEFTLKVE